MKATLFSVFLTTIILFTLQASHAEVFRWVDESGKIRIGIKPPAKSENAEKNKDSSEKTSKALPVITEPAKPTTPKIVEKKAKPPANTVDVPPATAPVTTPAPVVAPPEASSPVVSQPAKPVQKINVKKPAPVRKKAPAKKPDIKKAVVKKKSKPKEAAPAKKKTTAKKSAGERNEEMCGVFTGYVHDYEEKVRDCSKNLCDIYKRSLARYKKKQKTYCK
ncbi:MAG TPA: hypothetical protein ENK04_09445 [Gammaproteobacteria bacterium]|nr:hypothetical protein [Gammaproteobacteria bacterium]